MTPQNQKNKILHLIMCPFTGLGLHNGYRGDEWFKGRIEVFKNYTLKSLLNQNNKNFIHWLCFRAREEYNPICRKFIRDLKQIKDYKIVVTYGGIPFWDDKFENDNLLERLKVMIPQLKEQIDFQDIQIIYETILASDDMYSMEMTETIQRQWPGQGKAFGWRKGFILNRSTHQVAEYNPETNPPFYTLCYPKRFFLDPVAHFRYIGNIKSHEYVPDLFNYTELKNRGFCVTVGGDNISTTWSIPYKGRELNEEERKIALFALGIQDSKPIKSKLTIKIILRHIKHLWRRFKNYV